jgi:hypothetical protein
MIPKSDAHPAADFVIMTWVLLQQHPSHDHEGQDRGPMAHIDAAARRPRCHIHALPGQWWLVTWPPVMVTWAAGVSWPRQMV